ncbi:hybrid male rescue isoform X2 [Musca autumnalis]|uniref:hybrid male rescue isoform X2 n=1 Tax=Musca autumnalis TaxID=221902 RepID=UPI003CFA3A2F
MDCIVLDEDDEVMIAETETSNKDDDKEKSSKLFEKRLIRQVRKHRILYDNRNKLFSNLEKKEAVWQGIAKKLKSDVDTCKTTWIELRHKYQSYVRRLRKYFVNGAKKNGARPTMEFDSDLIYLFRFIENRKYCDIPYDIPEPIRKTEKSKTQQTKIDDDLILIEQPVELIVIDEDDDARQGEKQFKVTNEMRNLIAEIKKYPELYDTTRSDFNDYTRKSVLWNSIAVQLGDKATKLMKCWILMVTRYEWEISKTPQGTDVAKCQTELQKEMEFFEPYILTNPETVYKHSYYLKKCWCEPMDYFKEIYTFILRLKKIPDVVFLTDTLLKNPEKTKQFFTLWGDVSKMKGNSPGECETTWLIMRLFYWELMNMRQHSYQLTDKWYFEVIITELYEMAKVSPLAKQAEQQKRQEAQKQTAQQQPQQQKTNQSHNNAPANASKAAANTSATNTVMPATSPQMPPQSTPAAAAHQAPLPKITSAISLAPQVLQGSGLNSGLQIRPIGTPLVSNAAASTILPPKPATVLNGSLIPGNSIQLAYSLPESTQVSTINKSSLVSSTPNTILNGQMSSMRTAMSNAANNVNTANFNNHLVNPSCQVDLAPMVRINTAIKSTTVSSVNNYKTAKTPPAPNADTMKTITTKQMTLPTTPVAAISTPPPSQTAAGPLPKISNAVSLLNPNEILIELISSPNGNLLVINGASLSEKYQLTMPTAAKFIREVMAIPLLHYKKAHTQHNLVYSYWEYISNTFNMPTHICKACWHFLLENFNHFPQIAPLEDLMKPFTTSIRVWTETTALFDLFDKEATANGWLAYSSTLPEIVDSIGTYNQLYKDVIQSGKDSMPASYNDMEALCVYRTLNLRFPNIKNINSIWEALKKAFCQYMENIEMGIHNRWHLNWWRILARMKFLVEARYSTKEPYYYIVSNKMMEEIDRCATIEMRARIVKMEAKASTSKGPFETLSDTPRKHVETVTLLTAIEKYPIIYGKGDCLSKLEAWENVAKDLQMDLTVCLLAFRRACQKYCHFKKQDTLSRCHLNFKYYNRFENIFRNVKSNNLRKINIRTPSELNQSLDEENNKNFKNFVFPERYISDINMSTCESDLVVKNWIYAFGNLSPSVAEECHNKLEAILEKYIPS